jgi:heme/copper-type cytochrome/quinol oxidase subunit 1
VLLTLANAAYSARHGVETGADPWRGSTLEWFALSPPPPHNFDVIPDVRSAEPLRDIREFVRRRTETWEPPRPVERREPEPAANPAKADAGASEQDSR